MLVIIVPYRNSPDGTRAAQLKTFMEYMRGFLDGVKFWIIVVQQSSDGRLFNRGKLLNIGYDQAIIQLEEAGISPSKVNFIFHDVDLLPSESLKRFYIQPAEQPVHIAAVWPRYNQNPRYFGGVVAMNQKVFESINGYPNTFWGWGGEDDELFNRIQRRKIRIVKLDPSVGSFSDLENLSLKDKLTVLKQSNTKFMRKKEALAEHFKTWKRNGLKDLKYHELSKQYPCQECMVIEVDVMLNKHWTDDYATAGSGGAEMPTLTTPEEACQIAKAFLAPTTAQAKKPKSPWPLPPQAQLPWSQEYKALQNTMEYIFSYLGHKCYLLCVRDAIPHLFRLLPEEPKPTRRGIQRELASLPSNPNLTEAQKKYISEFVSEPVRVMQCIVKRYSADGTPMEYWSFVQDLDLPDGVFLLNLTDAVILRTDRRHPFPMLLDEDVPADMRGSPFIPIFSISSQEGYDDIPIPNYDDLSISQSRSTPKSHVFETRWSEKIPKAIFRGGPTGCGYTTDTNMRLRIAQIKHPQLDVRLTGRGKSISNRGIRLDPRHGLGTINSDIVPTEVYVSMQEQSKCMMIVHIDGNVNAYRLLGTMLTGSLILRVKSPYRSWADHLIHAGEHYQEVSEDLSDLIPIIEKVVHSTSVEYSSIARRGRLFAEQVLNYKKIKAYTSAIFNLSKAKH